MPPPKKKRKIKQTSRNHLQERQDTDGPLSEQQKTHLRSTWGVVYANKMKFSVALFVKFFTTHPEYQQLFRGLKDIENMDDLAKSPKLKAHGFRVVSAINNLVENLDSLDVFVEMVKNLARSHHGNKITRKHFENLGLVLVGAMSDQLGDKMTPKAKDAWTAAYGFIVDSVWEEYQAINDETANSSGGSSPEK